MDRRSFCWGLFSTTVVFDRLLLATPPLPMLAKPTVQWNYNLKAAHKLAVEQEKPLLIVFGASWCTYCHKLERETLGDKRVSTIVNRKFIPLHLDFDQDARVAKVLEVERLPCTVIINADADLLQKREGYLDCNQYLRTLESALEKSNQNQQTKGSAAS